ncbi:MAG: demethylmenaquinone methyltransferase/2-methoxy-6-polyprenyl-1,4-benzoquinol methylase [Chlamydiales bacterium]|jgi:demethylmenaquinone methyltransferase/2-methoxy-6-polyprenyl-1,4-benzoquinol methylase
MIKNNPYAQQSPESIQSMFNSIADRYDLGNSVLSFQMHKFWNRQLVKRTFPDSADLSIVDLCCGTGDIAFDYLKRSPPTKEVFLIDFSEEMLRNAKEKASSLGLDHHKISYIQGDALDIPLSEKTVDAVTVAYGIRNVQDPKKCIKEIHRILKPCGRIGILELTRPDNPFLRFFHKIYLTCILPILGKLVATNKEAYTYLSQSINHFSSPAVLSQILRESGFNNIEIKPLLGGIATILTAEKKA